MKVKCVASKLSENQARDLAIDKVVAYRITKDVEYAVIGISAFTRNGVNATLFWIKDDPGNYPVPIPHLLFEVLDARVSKYWVTETTKTGIRMMPGEFLEPDFLEDLTEFKPENVKIFSEVVSKLEQE